MRLKLAKVSHFASLTFLSWSMQNWPSLFGSMDFHSLRVELVAQWLNEMLSETSASVYESQVNISTIQIWIRLYSCIHWCYLKICVQACFISQHALDSCLDFFLNSHRCYYLVCGVNRHQNHLPSYHRLKTGERRRPIDGPIEGDQITNKLTIPLGAAGWIKDG